MLTRSERVLDIDFRFLGEYDGSKKGIRMLSLLRYEGGGGEGA